ncbi:MAG: RloB domain-containing protein [Magnetococcales bacterium]|nr:RloB domain-containing protein [Magnetococcales bacterium]
MVTSDHLQGERSPNSLERHSTMRCSRNRVLIVCPADAEHYFQDLADHLNLTNEIIIRVASSSDPVALVDEAFEISQKAPTHHRIFVLVDHPGQSDPLDSDSTHPIKTVARRIKNNHLPQNRIVRLLVTEPGFLLWLLLHFDQAEFSAWPASQWPKIVEQELELHIPHATRKASQKQFFAKTHAYLTKAIKRSQNQILARMVKPGPSTEIHELIGFLLKHRSRRANARNPK